MKIAGIEVEVIRKDIKNLHLAVYPPDGRVRLAAPADVNMQTLELYTTSKIGWIKRQQRMFLNQDRQPPRQYVDRESHYYLGKRYLLRVHETDNINRYPRIILRTKTYIDIYVKPGYTIEQKSELFKEWYRARFKELLPELTNKWERIVGVAPSTYMIKTMKTKWGSCKIETANINLNLELIKKPVDCIEYVLAHELTHLLERNHNDVFQAYMDRHIPKWKSIRDELNRLPVGEID